MAKLKYPFTKINRLSVFERFSGIDWNSIAEETSTWKDGTKGYLSVHKQGKLKSIEQLGYYYAVILPAIFGQFKKNQEMEVVIHLRTKNIKLPLTEANVDFFLKANYAEYHGEFKDKSDMSMGECSAFENWCILWAAKWLDCQIPPSDPNWQNKPHYET